MAIKPVLALRAAYVNDSEVALSWTNADAYDGVLIECRIGNGEWELYADARQTEELMYTDAVPNGRYEFRAIGFAGNAQAEPAYSGVVHTTPAPPITVQGYRNGDGSVLLSIDNTAQVWADRMEIERSTEASWIPLGSFPPLSTDIEDAMEDAAAYRARNIVRDLASTWTTTEEIGLAIQAPLPPDISWPLDGSTVVSEDGFLAIEWVYRGDGLQAAADLGYSADGSSWQHIECGEETACSVPVDGDTLYITLRTRNETGWSERSSVTIHIAQVPQLDIISPAGIVSSYPITVRYALRNDEYVISADATILDGAGPVAHRATYSSSTSFNAEDAPLESGREYEVRVEAISAAGITGSASSHFIADFSAPPPPRLHLTADNGAVRVVAYPGTGAMETASIAVFRLDRDGSRIKIAAGEQVHTVDMIPPLDCELSYMAVAYAADGAQAQAISRIIVPSDGRAYLNWGAGWMRWAFCWRNADFDNGTEKQVETYQALGRIHPLAYYGIQENVNPSVSARIPIAHVGNNHPRECTAAWKEAEKHIGTMCLRFPYMEGARHFVTADISVSISNDRYRMADLSVDCIEVTHDMA